MVVVGCLEETLCISSLNMGKTVLSQKSTFDKKTGISFGLFFLIFGCYSLIPKKSILGKTGGGIIQTSFHVLFVIL